jgi:putative CocE/NonD family hydrolase
MTSTRSSSQAFPFLRLLVRRILRVATLICWAALPAQSAAITNEYSKAGVMIPARDGVKLYTEIYAPLDQSRDLPIVFLRTPYRVADTKGGFTRYFASTFRELAKQRYIFAVQDARGRHRSEGKFEWNRPVRHRANPDAIDASTDAHDSIDWLIQNVANNNGRVGMLGVSYPGWYVTMALVDPHPALSAASPQASPSDYFIGDDFYHFGAFRLGPSAELPYLFDFDPKQNARFPFDQVDTYEFFLDLGPLSNMNKRYLKGVSPTWDNFMAHSVYDDYWKAGGTLPHLTEVSVPTLNVVGWWDAENLGGALDIYDKLEPMDDQGINRIVVGPWSHGQWARAPAESLGEYEFGSDTAAYYQREIEAPFFAHYLKDEGELKLPEAMMFQTGANEWKRYDAWPPRKRVSQRKLYFQPRGGLSFEPPADGPNAHESFISDPAKPVPYSQRPIMGFWSGLKGSKEARFGRAGKLWKVEDQRFVHDRPDVLSFVTEPLAEDLEIAGRIVAQLFASTSGTDSDWVVKLIDVYPESYPAKPEMGGYQLMIADDVLRGKFHESFEKPVALEPGKVTQFEIDLRTRNHLFRKGHRIMVQVQSSWFPLIDRNPQTFVDIPNARDRDYRRAEQRIYFAKDQASHIRLPIVNRN